MIKKGKQVTIEYSVSTDENTQVDSNIGGEPFIFHYGNHQILPALESQLLGLEVGDSKEITLAPEQAYGEVNPDAFKEVDSQLIPEDLRYEGALLVVADDQFGEMLIRVKSLKSDKVILDFNHPLAGKTLKFDIKIIDIS
ncbi:MAG: peptidylprolyl isomerase [Chlamydiota bacterium]